jgi:hypothetical protein
MCAFYAIPVEENEASPESLAWKHEGYATLDRFFLANDKEGGDVFPFLLDFLLGKVCENILRHPEEAKFRRLKKTSKAFDNFRSVKLGATLLDYLGFRDKVIEFEQWSTLPATDPDWLDDFRKRVNLIRGSVEKRQSGMAKEERTARAKAEADLAHKKRLLDRINGERAERKK